MVILCHVFNYKNFKWYQLVICYRVYKRQTFTSRCGFLQLVFERVYGNEGESINIIKILWPQRMKFLRECNFTMTVFYCMFTIWEDSISLQLKSSEKLKKIYHRPMQRSIFKWIIIPSLSTPHPNNDSNITPHGSQYSI